MSDKICKDRDLSVRQPIFLGIVWAIILIAGFGGWAITANLSGAVISQGVIEIEQSKQVVQHLEGGIVREIRVREGDVVRAGEVLIALDEDTIGSEMAIAEDQRNELMARIARLQAERDDLEEIVFPEALRDRENMSEELLDVIEGQERLFNARRDSMAQRIDQLLKRQDQVRSQILGSRSRATALERQMELLEEEHVTQTSLVEKGLSQASVLRNINTRMAEIEGQIGAVDSEIAGSEERVTEIDLEILSMQAERREQAQTELRDLVSNESELREKIHALSVRLGRLEIKSPADGVIHDLRVTTPSAVIRGADPVLYVIPQDRPLHIKSRVDPANIDQVSIGQNAILIFPAFAAQDLPDINGRIERISPDTFVDERTGQSWYEVDIKVTDTGVNVLAGNDLIPGMPVEAFIQTGDRTAAAYLLKPFTDFWNRAMREPT
ncbi:MAG: HlyD family type I secretion periplasmic adaptor subunit [Roseibium sp.]|uniref:HlyD family type I secretion periplasmic adaptor subunit n=1 Tax=Roseibium sp. TaxID=1936156 RepID=UPI003297B3C5